MATNRQRVNFIAIPDRIAPVAANNSDTYRFLLNNALKNGLKPILADLPDTKSGVMLIYPSEMAKIDVVREEYKLTFAAAFAGLCMAAVKSLQAEARVRIKGENAYLETVGIGSLKEARPDQAKYYEGILKGLMANKIVMAEASTGVGKGRAMMAAAVDMTRQNKQPVIVAAPTLSVMSQLYDEFIKLEIADVIIAIMPGRTEFVDDVKLKEYALQENILDDERKNEDVIEWVRKGGPNVTENALSKTMLAMGVKPAWLMDDLVAISGDFPSDVFSLTGDSNSDSKAEAILKNYKDKMGFDAQIIICSHTMLALAAKLTKKSKDSEKREWTILPEPSVLFIDEAHQLEQNIAQVNSEQLSFFSLRWRLSKFKRDHKLKSGTVVSKALRILFDVTKACRVLENTTSQSITLNRPETEFEAKTFAEPLALLSSLAVLLSSKSLAGMPGIKDDRKALEAISYARTTAGAGDRITLNFSPTRNYPSVMSGPSTMKPLLANIWNRATGGVVLASATLYTPEPDGTLKCDYVRDILGVSLERIYAPKPIESKHIYSIPVLHYPSKEKLQRLSAPSLQTVKLSAFEAATADWLKNTAREIFDGPCVNARGGTMVLCTAYTQVVKLAEELVTMGVLEDRIVTHERGVKFAASKEKFIAKHRSGLRPILLGLGVAWTGLDMADKTVPDGQDKQDTLLTDLVILRAPIGLNRTNAMASRVKRLGTYPIEKEALLLLKQGLGRLIRREHVTDRHIWIMDGRLWTDWKGMENFTAAARQLFAKYKKTIIF